MMDRTALLSEHLKTQLKFIHNNYEVVNSNLLNPLVRDLSANRNLYSQSKVREKLAKAALTALTGVSKNQDVAKSVVDAYINSPLGIFKPVLSTNNSDIFIVADRISMTCGNYMDAEEIVIPEALRPTYKRLVDTFIQMTIYASDTDTTKFDRKNAVRDYQSCGLRFNAVHSALNAHKDGTPIVAIRKQVVKQTSQFDFSNYLKSTGVNAEQAEFINELAQKHSAIVFGETGSGKTTMLKYMGNYGIQHKRNLITIEDTSELFLPVNIAYLTNFDYTIQDLFKITLRENPSHVIIGETRSAEIVDILESALVFPVLTSLHADSFDKVIMRILFMIKKECPNFTSEEINGLITSSMKGFIYMKNREVVEVRRRKPSNEWDLSDAMNNYAIV